MADLVLLKSYFHRHDAELALGLLKDRGIEGMISADDLAGYRPHLTYSTGNYRLLVKKEDAEKASDALLVLDTPIEEESALTKPQFQNEEENIEHKGPNFKKYFVCFLLFSLFMTGYFFTNERRYSYERIQKMFNNPNTNYKCTNTRINNEEITECRTFYYYSGKVRTVAKYKNDWASGPFQVYWENGKLRSDMNFVDNKLEGMVSDYYENGQLGYTEVNRNGLREGNAYSYYRTGELMSLEQYSKGQYHGKVITYDKKGTIIENLDAKNGILYDSYGKPLEDEKSLFYEDGTLFSLWRYKNGKLHGECIGYYENGQIEFSTHYVQGKLEGRYQSYFDNGKIQFIVDSKNDVMIREKEYNNNGLLIFRGDYR